jgi:hypothetical protein
MSRTLSHTAPSALAILLALGTARIETSAAQVDTAGSLKTDVSGPAKPSGKGFKVSKLEYEGWRQYSANCARCHGQDVLPNPVAANLLLLLGPGGPINSEQMFAGIVMAGRPASGMPPFKNLLTQDRIKAIYAYVKGRAEKRIPPGRPARPA